MRTKIALATLAAALMAAGASAGSYGYDHGNDRDPLSWTIVSGDNTSMSDMQDLDSMDDLKERFGDEFLFIRLGEDRYVIRDRALMKRAEEAARPMRDAGREIGKAARAQAKAALSNSRGAREQARLSVRIAKLSGRIARLESRGEPTEDLEREQERLAAARRDYRRIGGGTRRDARGAWPILANGAGDGANAQGDAAPQPGDAGDPSRCEGASRGGAGGLTPRA